MEMKVTGSQLDQGDRFLQERLSAWCLPTKNSMRLRPANHRGACLCLAIQDGMILQMHNSSCTYIPRRAGPLARPDRLTCGRSQCSRSYGCSTSNLHDDRRPRQRAVRNVEDCRHTPMNTYRSRMLHFVLPHDLRKCIVRLHFGVSLVSVELRLNWSRAFSAVKEKLSQYAIISVLVPTFKHAFLLPEMLCDAVPATNASLSRPNV